ncbi:NEDD8-conjugating enzyme UBC12-like protein 2 [Colletotrichum chlorophyti]|uniref:NEDD8-conjugating enzyme UBC12-like protein 2 n=1 Tax=Colletotrichum chlorophyti TaxID=708187 RepID=A0A1Q8RAR6_9PEZI|nr:NEDD8-conjugating enzyme UBC12-like protein 2 [Colletotrichum chlorophyti]
MAEHLRRRLLQDIAELQQKPYPRISLYTVDEDLSKACLVLQPEGWMPIHTTVTFGTRYPLVAPTIQMNTKLDHPNVFNSYICASILNTFEGYTPAYTLKGIAIQLLSFFNSDSIEQSDGSYSEDLRWYRERSMSHQQSFKCSECGFDGTKSKAETRRVRRHGEKASSSTKHRVPAGTGKRLQHGVLATLPDELLLKMLDNLDFEDLVAFSQAWTRVADIVTKYDVIRLRELQCFCTKTNFQQTKLGVGIAVPQGKGRRSIESEFDLISEEAFRDLSIRLSVHNIRFQYWLPLPLSHRHWKLVRGHVTPVLKDLAASISLPSTNCYSIDVLASFMNEIVVRLNQVEARELPIRTSSYNTDNIRVRSKSTLRHASEKAIESYFHLFHILLCLATADHEIVDKANAKIQTFLEGKTSKVASPNLGHLLVYLLISDVKITERLRKSIITEAITRNVVWMLDKRGSNMPELSYLEPDAVSAYRLKKTFEASRTSYRLLMFSELFRRIARPSNERGLEQVRDELFDRHGAPPPGAALHLSTEVRRLHDVNNFPDFFKEMGIVNTPTAERFTYILRNCVKDSMRLGYSAWGMPADTALALRCMREPNVGLNKNSILRNPPSSRYMATVTFFPNKNQQQRTVARR